MARVFKHGDNRTWELALKAIHQLGGSASASDILGLIVKSETGYKESNLHADLNAMSVNSPSRGGSNKNKKPRSTDSGNKYDALFKHGDRKNAVYEIYDPRKHGVWEIYTDNSAKTGLSIRRVETESSELAQAQNQADEEDMFDLSITKDVLEHTLNDIHHKDYFERKLAQEIEASLADDKGRQARLKKALKTPKRTEVLTTQFQRNPDVIAEVLMRAKGFCENCEKAAPFKRKNGMPYLEVHHKIRLADGGEDVVENAIALCPNCHRYLHYGV